MNSVMQKSLSVGNITIIIAVAEFTTMVRYTGLGENIIHFMERWKPNGVYRIIDHVSFRVILKTKVASDNVS